MTAAGPGDAHLPLRGIRVLDLTQNVAGPYATLLLADLGAEVLKVEKPGTGDDTRSWVPAVAERASGVFVSLNRNKESVAIDIRQPEGQDLVRRLADTCDVFVQSLRPGTLERYGLGAEQLRRRRPSLVYASLSGYGRSGPLGEEPAYDPVIQAYTGMMRLTGGEGRPAVRVGPAIVDMGTGMLCALAIVSALHQRQITGRGTHVEASLLEAGVAWMAYHITNPSGDGEAAQEETPPTATSMIAPYETLWCGDEELFIAAGNDRLFQATCQTLGVAELAGDARFVTNESRIRHRRALRELMEARLSTRSAAFWETALRGAGVPCSRVRHVRELPADEQVQALGLIGQVPVMMTSADVALRPFRIDGHRGEAGEVPLQVGEATAARLAEIGVSEQELAALAASGVVEIGKATAPDDASGYGGDAG